MCLQFVWFYVHMSAAGSGWATQSKRPASDWTAFLRVLQRDLRGQEFLR